jgi:hypothetical protein
MFGRGDPDGDLITVSRFGAEFVPPSVPEPETEPPCGAAAAPSWVSPDCSCGFAVS